MRERKPQIYFRQNSIPGGSSTDEWQKLDPQVLNKPILQKDSSNNSGRRSFLFGLGGFFGGGVLGFLSGRFTAPKEEIQGEKVCPPDLSNQLTDKQNTLDSLMVTNQVLAEANRELAEQLKASGITPAVEITPTPNPEVENRVRTALALLTLAEQNGRFSFSQDALNVIDTETQLQYTFLKDIVDNCNYYPWYVRDCVAGELSTATPIPETPNNPIYPNATPTPSWPTLVPTNNEVISTATAGSPPSNNNGGGGKEDATPIP